MPSIASTRCWSHLVWGWVAAGVGLLSTIIAAPIVVALEAAAVACGLAGIAGKYISRRLLVKAKKTRRDSRSRPIKAQQHNECDLKRAPRWAHLSRGVQASTRRDGKIWPDEG